MPKHPSHIELLARGLLVENGRVLLCKNLSKNYHYLPGGHVEPGESSAAALAREFLEETGQKVQVGPCLLTAEQIFEQDGKRHHEVSVVFHVERGVRNEVISLEQHLGFEWFLMTNLPADLRPQSARLWLEATPPRPTWIPANSAQFAPPSP